MNAWRGRDAFLAQRARGAADKKINIKLECFAKIDVLITDTELTLFSYGVGKVLRRSIRGLVK